jgi:hypothetical protein
MTTNVKGFIIVERGARCQAEFADVNAEAHGAIFTETERGELPGVFQ